MNFLQPGHTTKQYNSDQGIWEDLDFTGGEVGLATTSPPTPQPKRKRILVDVAKLVKGEVPGHTAVSSSSTDIYVA